MIMAGRKLTELGGMYAGAGKFAEAEPLLQRAADIRHSDPNPLIEASANFNWVRQPATAPFRRRGEGLSRRRNSTPANSAGPSARRPLHVSLGALYDDQQDYAKAEACSTQRRAVEHPPPDHAPGSGRRRHHVGMEVSIGKFRPNFIYAMEAWLASAHLRETKSAGGIRRKPEGRPPVDRRPACEE